jgi:beta-lactamase superfamily II metal-dependent hydrolase
MGENQAKKTDKTKSHTAQNHTAQHHTVQHHTAQNDSTTTGNIKASTIKTGTNKKAATTRNAATRNDIMPTGVTKNHTPTHDTMAVTIRMYNVGFGDCFLLQLPTTQGKRKVLFDCGTISSKRPLQSIVDQLLTDVMDADGVPRIDVVVGTHRHRDHVSGFSDKRWKNVEVLEVREVWMPWTEDPKDAEAKHIRETQSRLALNLTHTFSEHVNGAITRRERGKFERYQKMALNALSNEAAMATLHDGFGGSPLRRFLPEREVAELRFQTDALPGITVHVLGPSHDPAVIRDMDPPAGQSYLRSLDLSSDGVASPPPDPFRRDWWLASHDFEALYPGLLLNAVDREKMQRFDLIMQQAVATSLDKAVNGTSLMIMLQIGEAFLLFPGDAQWGTWQAALQNPEARSLLARTTFYKVGHHGSHNATPVEFVEKTLGTDFWAMVSTGQVPQWPNIPRAPLLAAIGQRTGKLTRSDQLPQVGLGAVSNGNLAADVVIPLNT